MNIIITGGSGKLGVEIKNVFPDAFVPTHQEFDVTSLKKISIYFENIKPDLIIHAAAITDVRLCENDKDLAWNVNVEGTRNLVKACRLISPSTKFVYISTACVFDGKRGMYSEEDLPGPKNYYSITKTISEFIIRELESWLVLRTNFVSHSPWPYPKAFTDRFGTYLYSEDVAKAIKEIINEDWKGVLHICGEKKISMFELAKLTNPKVEPITIAEYSGPPLTMDMSLKSTRIHPFKMSIPKDKHN